MITIRFVSHGGLTHEVTCTAGQSLMSAAVANGVAGINADCGGSLACGTCHVYVAAGHEARLPPPSEYEREMLAAGHNTRSNSRLSCQVWLEEHMDGLEVHTPESQYP